MLAWKAAPTNPSTILSGMIGGIVLYGRMFFQLKDMANNNNSLIASVISA
jgi:hypothetical protein